MEEIKISEMPLGTAANLKDTDKDVLFLLSLKENGSYSNYRTNHSNFSSYIKYIIDNYKYASKSDLLNVLNYVKDLFLEKEQEEKEKEELRQLERHRQYITIYSSYNAKPSIPIGGIYNYTLNTLSTCPSGWQTTYDNLQLPVWSSSTTFISESEHLGWTSPTRLIIDGSEFASHTLEIKITIFKNSVNKPNTPTSGEYDFTNGEFLKCPTEWSRKYTVAANNEDTYFCIRTFYSDGSSTNWSLPIFYNSDLLTAGKVVANTLLNCKDGKDFNRIYGVYFEAPEDPVRLLNHNGNVEQFYECFGSGYLAEGNIRWLKKDITSNDWSVFVKGDINALSGKIGDWYLGNDSNTTMLYTKTDDGTYQMLISTYSGISVIKENINVISLDCKGNVNLCNGIAKFLNTGLGQIGSTLDKGIWWDANGVVHLGKNVKINFSGKGESDIVDVKVGVDAAEVENIINTSTTINWNEVLDSHLDHYSGLLGSLQIKKNETPTTLLTAEEGGRMWLCTWKQAKEISGKNSINGLNESVRVKLKDSDPIILLYREVVDEGDSHFFVLSPLLCNNGGGNANSEITWTSKTIYIDSNSKVFKDSSTLLEVIPNESNSTQWVNSYKSVTYYNRNTRTIIDGNVTNSYDHSCYIGENLYITIQDGYYVIPQYTLLENPFSEFNSVLTNPYHIYNTKYVHIIKVSGGRSYKLFGIAKMWEIDKSEDTSKYYYTDSFDNIMTDLNIVSGNLLDAYQHAISKYNIPIV